MNCKICGKELTAEDKGLMVGKEDKRYGVCNVCIEAGKIKGNISNMEKSEKKDKKSYKSNYISVFQLLYGLVTACGIVALFANDYFEMAIGLLVGSVIFEFLLNIPITIIDLLQSIDETLKKEAK